MLEALDKMGRPYRLAYSSESHAGLSSAVRAGVAITALARAALPDDFRLLGPNDGFPELPSNGLGIIRAKGSSTRAIDSFASHVEDYFEAGAPQETNARVSPIPAHASVTRGL